jgi:hypothetical protein
MNHGQFYKAGELVAAVHRDAYRGRRQRAKLGAEESTGSGDRCTSGRIGAEFDTENHPALQVVENTSDFAGWVVGTISGNWLIRAA